MSGKTAATVAPPRVRVGAGAQAAEFFLVPEKVAFHGLPSGVVPKEAVDVFGNEGIAVFEAGAQGEAARPSLEGETRRGPVYATSNGGSLAVPTGRIFLRLVEGGHPLHLTPDLASLGFAIQEIPSHAPHTAWLAPVSGDVTKALAALEDLARLPGVRGVEPQMLMRRVPR
jgi:hypothetical protein